MAAWITRLGTLLAIATLTLTPAARVACLVMCASPAGVGRASADARRIDRAPPVSPAHHAHHHPRAAAGAGAAAAPAAAGVSTAANRDARCDVPRRGSCGDVYGLAPLPAGRTPATEAAIVPVARLAAAGLRPSAAVATRVIRVPPPGPPPASTPLRL